MKKLLIILPVAILAFTSCQKKVTDLPPIDRITSDLAFSTPARIEAAVVGSYDGLQSAEFLSGRALIYADLMGEDVIDKNSFFGTLPRFDQLGNAGLPANVWTAAYNSIGRANRAIAGITANAAILNDPVKQKAFIGEAKFIRAIAHFYLVNFFAQSYAFTADASHDGVPVITESFTSNDPAANKPRASVAVVYTAIINDLNEAIVDLPLAYANASLTKSRATKAAAAALLSRVYLYKNDFTNAKTTAGKIFNGDYGAFSLNANPDGVFGPGRYTTAETIFSIPNSTNDNPNTNNALPQHYFETGRGDIAVSPTFINAATNPFFAADDRRRGLIVANTIGANAGWFYTRKYPDVATRADWAPIVRYAEILLTYAEASARLAAGVDADAIAKLNLVRDRSRVSAPQYTVASFASKDELIAAILAERRIELAFEGHRYFDLARIKAAPTNKLDSDKVTPINVTYGSNKFIFPIPQAEVDKSGGVLKQNPGY
jgi:starch-binding outer membrane protein, SusD/RagB family